jgi:hypothetical protein
MGKKKSKIAKKKQAKQASRKFGVVVKKATGGREQSLSSAVSVSFQDGTKKILLKKSATRKKMFATISPKTHLQHAKNEEHDDFKRQMASAQERSQARAGKMKPKKAQLKLTPATLIVDDKQKSTSRLLEETTSHLESGLNGIGAAATVPQRRSLAAYAASNNAWANHDLSQPCTLESDNPYAALHQEDDSDEDAQPQRLADVPTLPLFRLAPPTFAFGTSTNDDDLDPDL